MLNVVILLIALIWTVGALIRVYRQARFYQIEEYKSNRYLRWWLSKRERTLPTRTIAAAAAAALFGFFLNEGGDLLPTVIWIIGSVIAMIPPGEGEIKKRFNPTARAKRLLGAAFTVTVLLAGLLMLLMMNLPEVSELRFLATGGAGLLLYLGVPLWLCAGNVLMTPVEAALRRRYLAKARGVIEQLHPTIIGITGSYGKTTTKHFITDILNGRYQAYATPKSYNTMMGVSMAINNDLTDNYAVDYFVVEMGAYIRGEIQRICSLTPPHIGVITEVGPQHLERFGSLENIAIAKYELIKALPPDGVGVFNWDNPYVREMYERGYPATRLTVSRTVSPDSVQVGVPRFIATDVIETLDGLTFTVTDTETGMSVPVTTAVVGEHNVTNILLATAAAVHEGMTLEEVAFRVRQLRPAESRLVRQDTAQGITIINDAYSANPVGAMSALKVLGMHTTGRRLLITPGMIELADLHEAENRKLGQAAAQYTTDIILVGSEQTRPIKQGLEDANFPPEAVRVVDTLSEAVAWYQKHLKPGDVVLFLNDLPDTY